MHQAQWSPERPLPPPVSLASQSHHEKPPEASLCPDLFYLFSISCVHLLGTWHNPGKEEAVAGV